MPEAIGTALCRIDETTHGALFRIDDGRCLAGPCQGDRLEPFPIAVRDGVVYALEEFAADFE